MDHDRDVSIEISRARHLVDVTMDVAGDLAGLDATEIMTRERICALLACLQRDLLEIEATLYPSTISDEIAETEARKARRQKLEERAKESHEMDDPHLGPLPKSFAPRLK